MNKLAVFLSVLCISKIAHADSTTEFDAEVDRWQRSYPIVGKLRKELAFQRVSKRRLSEVENNGNTSISPQKIFLEVIMEVVPPLIPFMKNPDIYNIVEGMDPVTRILKSLQTSPIESN